MRKSMGQGEGEGEPRKEKGKKDGRETQICFGICPCCDVLSARLSLCWN